MVLGYLNAPGQTYKTYFSSQQHLTGLNNPDAMAQPFGETLDDLPIVKSDFRIKTLSGDYGSEQWYASVAMDSSGYHAVAWLDNRQGLRKIYVQFYDAQNRPIGKNMLIRDQMVHEHTAPQISANAKGDYVLVWRGSYDERKLYAQRFNKTGQKIGDIIVVEDNISYANFEISVAVNNDGSFLVAWMEEFSSLVANLFDKSGKAIKTHLNFKGRLNASVYAYNRFVTVDKYGNYWVAWTGKSGSKKEIYVQRLDAQGNYLGSYITVNEEGDRVASFGTINRGDGAHILVLWNKDISGYGKDMVKGRVLDNNGNFVTDPFEVDTGWVAVATWLKTGHRFAVIYESDFTRLKYRFVGTDGIMESDPDSLPITEDKYYYTYWMDATNESQGIFYLAKMQYRRNDTEVFLQRYNSDFQPQEELIRVNDDRFASWQYNPSIICNQSGYSVVFWTDHRNGRVDLYARVFDPSFQPVGPDVKINDGEPDHWFLEGKSVCTLSDGTFVFAFSGGDIMDRSSIYLQKIGQNGQKIGPNVLVSKMYSSYNVKVHSGLNDHVLITWFNRRQIYSIFLQEYDKDLQPLDSVRYVLGYHKGIERRPYTIGIDDQLRVFAIWEEKKDGYPYNEDRPVYGMFFDKKGQTLQKKTKLAEIPAHKTCRGLSVYMRDPESYAFSWVVDKMYLKRYYPDLPDPEMLDGLEVPKGKYTIGPVKILKFQNKKILASWAYNENIIAYFYNDNKQTESAYSLYQPGDLSGDLVRLTGYYTANFAIFKDKIFLVYGSMRTMESSFDIWGRVLQTKDINLEPERYYQPVTDDVFYGIFPNPFNTKTKITFKLLSYHRVKITIYNVLGQKIKEVLNKNLEKGFYEIEFDATDLSSGVYFCRLEAFRTFVRKMVVLK